MKYNLHKPVLIVIHGPMGAGKTSLADILHDEISNLAHFGVDHIKWLISDGKTNPERKETNRQMVYTMTDEYLQLGTSALVEHAFTKEGIEKLKTIAENHNAPFFVYNLTADRDVLNARIKERTDRLGKPEISKEHIDTSYDEYIQNIYHNSTEFNSQHMSIRDMANRILKDLGL